MTAHRRFAQVGSVLESERILFACTYRQMAEQAKTSEEQGQLFLEDLKRHGIMNHAFSLHTMHVLELI